jgi:hypothetical protein
MGWVQQISLQFVGTADSRVSAPPGNPKIWEILTEKVGPFVCRRRQSLLLEWSSKPKTEVFSETKMREIFKMNGLFEVHVTTENPFVVFQVKRKGRTGEALVSLFEEWIDLQNLDSPDIPKVTLVRDFVFSALDAKGLEISFLENQMDVWVQALESIATMGAKSGIFFPESEQIRILKPGPWPSNPEFLNSSYSPDQMPLFFDQLIREAPWANMRRPYKVGVHKPRSKVSYTVVNPRIVERLKKISPSNPLNEQFHSTEFSAGPLNLLVSHPMRSDGYSSLEKFRYRCESYASLVDSPLGMTVFRSPSSGPLMIEPLNGLPIQSRFLSKVYESLQESQNRPELALFSVADFDMRNPLMWRKLKVFFSLFKPESLDSFSEYAEIWEGGQNWALLLFELLQTTAIPGWEIQFERKFEDFLNLNDQRCRFHRAVSFWVSVVNISKLTELASRCGISLTPLGQEIAENSGIKIKKGTQIIFQKQVADLSLNSNVFLRPEEIDFYEQDLKSPTYGFDRPAHFPDEFMVKASVRDPLEPLWNQEIHKVYASQNYRSVLVRGEGSLVIPAFRWSVGEDVIAESYGTREGWMDVNPRESGRAAVDSAVRWLVAMGAEPVQGTSQIWAPKPEDFDSEESHSTLRAQSLLAIDGALEALQSFQFSVRQTNFEGASNPQMKNELFFGLRKKVSAQSVPAFPGFRMVGEVLFMVGPKPAFMDGGSRVLNHISRVFSNHVTVLDFTNQLELYLLVHSFLVKGIITCIRPINEAGLISTAGEMALWGGMGAQIRPTVSTIELFSGSPGRFLVGVLPQEAKKFESAFKSEQIVLVGTTGGEKIFGLTLSKLVESRMRGAEK